MLIFYRTDVDVLTRCCLENLDNSIEIVYRVTPGEFVRTAAAARDEPPVAKEVTRADRIAVIAGERPIDISVHLEVGATIVKPHGVEINMSDAGKEQAETELVVAVMNEEPFVPRVGPNGGDRN